MRFLALPFLLVALLASAANAQHGSMMMAVLQGGDSFRPDLSARDLKVIIRVLRLPPESQAAVQALYDGYAGTLATEGLAVREYVAAEIERAEVMQNVDFIAPARKRVDEWQKRSEQIKKTFLDDLKSLLTKDEEARWPIVERELRRLRMVASGILSGEDVDLVKLTEEVLDDAPTGGELAEVLNKYSDEFDRALVHRAAVYKENKKVYEESLRTDADKARGAWKAVQDARLAVQAVNDRYARLIGAAVPEGKREAFERKWFEQCFQPVCRPTRMDEYLKDAQKLETLTAEQVTRLKDIRAKYEARVWQHREAAARAWRVFEDEFRKGELEEKIRGESVDRHQQYNGAWLPEGHPINMSRRERLEIDREFRKQVDAVLTAEQEEAVSTRLTPFARFENWQPYGL